MLGDLSGDAPVLVRMHQLNPLEDVLGVGGAGELPAAMRLIAAEGRGVVVLLDDRFARPEVRALMPAWWGMEGGGLNRRRHLAAHRARVPDSA